MKLFSHDAWLWLPYSLDKVFPFFADAHNLERLTPPFLKFRVVTPDPIVLGLGQRIAYRLRVHGIPVSWESEVTRWEPPNRFVDEQRRGPYRLWHHEHRFCERGNGTLVADHVLYSVWGGSLVNRLFVARDVRRIFNYRREQLAAIFPGASDPPEDLPPQSAILEPIS